MEWIIQKKDFLNTCKKYRYVLIAVLVGILLMVTPDKKSEPSPVEQNTPLPEADLETALEAILCEVAEAGKVDVLLTLQAGEHTVYQSDEFLSDSDMRRDTVLVNNADRGQAGLVQQVIPPVYRGAVVLCQGADLPQVRLAIVEAVKSATGLSSDRITVLKMK